MHANIGVAYVQQGLDNTNSRSRNRKYGFYWTLAKTPPRPVWKVGPGTAVLVLSLTHFYATFGGGLQCWPHYRRIPRQQLLYEYFKIIILVLNVTYYLLLISIIE